MGDAWTRLWLVACPPGEREAKIAALLAGVPLAALAHAPSAAAAAARLVAGRGIELAQEATLELEGSGSTAGSALAALAAEASRRGAGGEVVFFAPPAGLRVLVRLALGLDGELEPFALRPGTLAALEWPVESSPERQPLLAGLDLDWIPPRAAPARFPGGPGSAPSGR